MPTHPTNTQLITEALAQVADAQKELLGVLCDSPDMRAVRLGNAETTLEAALYYVREIADQEPAGGGS